MGDGRGWVRAGGLGVVLAGLAVGARGAAPPPPTPAPTVRIAVEPLGFVPPSHFYMPYRVPSVTLDFLDATHLLFTFHVAVLMHRNADDPASANQQTVRAVVLHLPDGHVEQQRQWLLHDRGRYLWMLNGGQFVLRIGNDLLQSDLSLGAKQYLEVPGQLMSVQVSPAAKTLVAEYGLDAEPASPSQPPAANGDVHSAAPSLGGDGTSLDAGDTGDGPAKTYQLILVNTATRKGQRYGRLTRPLEFPLVDGGFLGVEPQNSGSLWNVMLAPFTGEARDVATVRSPCRPIVVALSEHSFATQSCLPGTEDRHIEAFDLDGHRLWEKRWQSRYTWGTFAFPANGRRFAYGTVEVDHPLASLDPVATASILGQPIGIFDLATGDTRMVVDANPILTAGENFALSPDGQQLAVLRNGAIELYSLPPAPAVSGGR